MSTRSQDIKSSVDVGTCLSNKFDGSILKVIGLERMKYVKHPPVLWYKARVIATGRFYHIREDYIPASYEVVKCPDVQFPPKPAIKLGDYVQWRYTKRRKEFLEKGKVVGIRNDEVKIEIEREILGVKGFAFKDIYELELAELPPPQEGLTLADCESKHSAAELKEMARKAGLETTGSKRSLCRVLINKGLIK